MRQLRLLFLFIVLSGIAGIDLFAQCDDWRAQAVITTPSNCSPTHSVTVQLSGTDVSRLTNIQYGIPIGFNGYSAPLQSSPTFAGLQSGVYKFSAVGMCNGVYVGRNTTLYVDAGYAPPTLYGNSGRASLSCGATGTLHGSVGMGAAPFTFSIVSHPAAYTGIKTKTLPYRYGTFDSMPPGNYVLRVTDSCGAVATDNVTIASVNESTIPLSFHLPMPAGCDSLHIFSPSINTNVSGWAGYYNDSGFTATAVISGGLSPVSPPLYLGRLPFPVKLPAGKTLKDCYGKTINYVVTMPCGTPVSRTYTIPAPSFAHYIEQHCDRDFDFTVNASGLFCYPLSLSLRNVATNQVYGPFTAGGQQVPLTGSGIPLGSYQVTVTTGDGYVMSNSVVVSPVGANPYSVTVEPGKDGLNGWASGFRFATTGPTQFRTVELFSGPAGYVVNTQWWGSSTFVVNANGTPTPTTIHFPPGNYVWKITDDCGIYYLTVRVTASDLYSYVIDSISQRITCDGLEIRTWVRSWRNGVPQPDPAYSILLDSWPYGTPHPSGGFSWEVFPSGAAVTLRYPGTYNILATSMGHQPVLAGTYPIGTTVLGYPNRYNVSANLSFNRQPLWIDTDLVQGFVCQGAQPGSAQIHLNANGGVPFRSSGGAPYYRYSLAVIGNGYSGPYIATNTTGVFTGFNGPPNAWYDVKISDACGDSLIRRVQILDLGRVGLITSSEYVVCRADSLRLSALFLPNATYTWSGPNGFSSTLRRPLIAPLMPANSGVYRLTATTSACPGSVRDTSILAVNNVPHKPTISYACDPRPPLVTVTNPLPGNEYLWDFGRLYFNGTTPEYIFGYIIGGRTPYSQNVPGIGKFCAIARDSITGCESRSDTLTFDSDPFRAMKVTVKSPRLSICTGDTTTLQVDGVTSLLPKIQWFRNGAAITGATGELLVVHQPGTYRVAVEAGVCDKDTSPAVQVRVVSPPQVHLTASDTLICEGDTAILHTPHAASYSYSWMVDSNTVPGAFDSTLRATRTGVYSVIVSNGACIVQSPWLRITVNPVPRMTLNPEGEIHICPGQVYPLTVSSAPGVTFAWSRDSVRIPGGTGSTLPVSQSGTYHVTGSIPGCSDIESPPVIVKTVTAPVRLPADTTICNDDPFVISLRIADTGFRQIVWSTGESGPGIDVSKTGTYWARGVHRCGIYSDTMRIHSYRDYFPMWPADTFVCNASGISVLRVPALLRNVRWSTGATGHSITARKQGMVHVEGESPCGPVRDSIELKFCPPEIRDMGIGADTLCVGDCIRPVAVTHNYPVYHYWSFAGAAPDTGFGSHPGTFCYRHPGTYRIALRVENPGGTDSAFAEIVVVQKPAPRFRDTAVIAPYRSKVALPACADAAHADWYRNDSLICSDCPVLHLDANYYFNRYRCVVRNAGCPDSCSYALRVIDIPHEIWLPDAFTPNGDGRNDRFGIITDNPNVQVINFEIFNRWGQRVYSGNLNNDGWDGTFAGRPAEMGTFHWQLRYKVLDKPEVVHYLKGDLLLIR